MDKKCILYINMEKYREKISLRYSYNIYIYSQYKIIRMKLIIFILKTIFI